MDVTFVWGTDAIDAGFGRAEQVVDLLDWAILDVGEANAATASSSFLEFFAQFEGQNLALQLEGSNITTSSNELTGGDITTVTIYDADTGSASDAIAVFEGTFDGAELRNLAISEFTIPSSDAIETFFGDLNWTYTGTSLGETVPGGLLSEDDVEIELRGNDTITLGGGGDLFSAGRGDDKIFGQTGRDSLFGEEGADSLYGGDGGDFIDGGSKADLIEGGAGADFMLGGDGADVIKGGKGSDLMFGGAGADKLSGGKGKDLLIGDNGSDRLKGDREADALFGGNGDDKLFGGQGRDILFAAAGDNKATGGIGQDTFIFDAQAGHTDVKDFEVGSDRLAIFDVVTADDQEGVDELGVTAVGFDTVGITFESEVDLIETYAAVTAQGVQFDFGNGASFLLEGLTSTDGLADNLLLASLAEDI